MTSVQTTMMERVGPPGWEPHEVASAVLNASHAEFVRTTVAPLYLLVQSRALSASAINDLVTRTCAYPGLLGNPMTALVTELGAPAGEHEEEALRASLPPPLGLNVDTLALEGAVIVPLCRSEHARPLVLGRSSHVDIPVRHASISKMHATFSYDATGKLTLREHGSKNGTFVNGSRLSLDEHRTLESGTRLVFGKVGAHLVDASTLWRVLDGVAQ